MVNAGDEGSIFGLGRSPGKRNGYPLQYSHWENPMDKGAYHSPWVHKESDTTEHTHVCTRAYTHTHTHTKSESSKMEFKRFLGKIPIFIFMKLRLKFSISFHCE